MGDLPPVDCRPPSYHGAMSEVGSIRLGGPFTRSTLARDLRHLGVDEDATLVVHSSLSRLGWVAGGAHAVVLALLDTVGPGGTLVMPTHSGSLSDPGDWQNPPVPESWWHIIRDETPAFDPLLTPTRGMGLIPECFRHVDGVRRSGHPLYSFAAHGPHRDAVVDGHRLEDGLGEGSPLARLYELDAQVLLLGVGHDNNTSLHLGEHRAALPSRRFITQRAPVLVDGARRRAEWNELETDESDFEQLGADFAVHGQQRTGRVGVGAAHLMDQRSLVDFAVEWFTAHRNP